jgi:hypothetical protein
MYSTYTSYLKEKVAATVYKSNNTAVGIRRDDHVAVYPQKLALTSPTSGGRLAGILHSQTQAMEFSFFLVLV